MSPCPQIADRPGAVAFRLGCLLESPGRVFSDYGVGTEDAQPERRTTSLEQLLGLEVHVTPPPRGPCSKAGSDSAGDSAFLQAPGTADTASVPITL